MQAINTQEKININSVDAMSSVISMAKLSSLKYMLITNVNAQPFFK